MEKHVSISIEEQSRREKKTLSCVIPCGPRVPGLEGGLHCVSVEILESILAESDVIGENGIIRGNDVIRERGALRVV